MHAHLLHHREDDAKLALHASPNDDALSAPVADERAHEADVAALADGQSPDANVAIGDRVNVLARGVRLPGEGRLVDIEVVRGGETDVGRDAVSGAEGDEVSGHEHVRELGRLVAVPNE